MGTLSKLSTPITTLVKWYASKSPFLDEKFSKSNTKSLEIDRIKPLLEDLKPIYKKKKGIASTWEQRLFKVECIRAVVITLTVGLVYFEQEKYVNIFKGKTTIIITPKIKFSVGIISTVEAARIGAKSFYAYHDKQLKEVKSAMKRLSAQTTEKFMNQKLAKL